MHKYADPANDGAREMGHGLFGDGEDGEHNGVSLVVISNTQCRAKLSMGSHCGVTYILFKYITGIIKRRIGTITLVHRMGTVRTSTDTREVMTPDR